MIFWNNTWLVFGKGLLIDGINIQWSKIWGVIVSE